MQIKNYFKRIGAMTLATALFISFTGCEDDDPAPLQQDDIVAIVVNNPDFSYLEAAVLRAGLADTLKTQGLTVFAPTNAAFVAAGFPTEAAITAADVNVLKAVLRYHVLTSIVKAADVPAGPNAEVTTYGGGKIFATRNASGVFINGIKVDQADLSAKNGVIHVINKVLLPPAANIAGVAIANPNFARLVQALTKTGLVPAVNGADVRTVFAPTNAAFVTAGFDSTAIANADAATVTALSDVLKFHVLNGRAFSSDITNGGTAATLLTGKSITFAINGASITAKGAGNGTNSALISPANIMATNGVIHVIDRVLLP